MHCQGKDGAGELGLVCAGCSSRETEAVSFHETGQRDRIMGRGARQESTPLKLALWPAVWPGAHRGCRSVPQGCERLHRLKKRPGRIMDASGVGAKVQGVDDMSDFATRERRGGQGRDRATQQHCGSPAVVVVQADGAGIHKPRPSVVQRHRRRSLGQRNAMNG